MPGPRRRMLIVIALAAALAAFPLGALAIHDFADVPDSNPFHADISALAATGVTTGCGGGNFCPGAFVTREQMAAFMNRLGALAAGKDPVVNADRLDGHDSAHFYGDHTKVQWDFSLPATGSGFGSSTVSETILPAGSTIQSLTATLTLTEVPSGCAHVDPALDTFPFNGYFAAWDIDTSGDITDVAATIYIPSAPVVLSFDVTLRFTIHCWDGPFGQEFPNAVFATPAVSGNIVLNWTQPPVVIP